MSTDVKEGFNGVGTEMSIYGPGLWSYACHAFSCKLPRRSHLDLPKEACWESRAEKAGVLQPSLCTLMHLLVPDTAMLHLHWSISPREEAKEALGTKEEILHRIRFRISPSHECS